MKRIILLASFAAILLGCNSTQNTNDKGQDNFGVVETSKEILFKVKEDGGYEIVPWISLQEPEEQIKYLRGKDDLVLKGGEAILVIDYPLSKPVEMEIHSGSPKGFKRGELVLLISKEYKRIYKEEEESSRNKTTPIDERERVINRNRTNGKYGIWGHDLGDLDLSAVIVKESNNGRPRLELVVES